MQIQNVDFTNMGTNPRSWSTSLFLVGLLPFVWWYFFVGALNLNCWFNFQMALSANGLPSIPIWVIMIFSKYLSIDYSNFSLFSDVFWHPKENWLVASQLRKCRGRWRFATSDCHAWSRNWWQGPCSYSGSSRRLWPCLKHGSVDLSRDGEPWDIE